MTQAIGARAGAGAGRRQADDQWAGELYAGRQFHPRRRAGMRQHVCRRRLQCLRHCVRRRRRLGAGAMGGRSAKRRSISGSSISAVSPTCIGIATGCATRTLEAYGKHYTIGFPHEEYESGRPSIVSPLYERLQKHRACFGSKLGWERPNWFAPGGVEPQDIYSMGRQNWFDALSATSIAHVREAVGLFDQSSFAKYELTGTDALRRSTGSAPTMSSKPPGRSDLYATAQLAAAASKRSDRRAAGGGKVLHRHRHRLPHP